MNHHLRRPASIVAGLALVALASIVLGAQSTIAGAYSTTVTVSDLKGVPGPQAEKMAGTWTVAFADDGTYTVRQGDTEHVQGKYTIDGDEVTMNDAHGDFACVGDELEGVYRVRRDGTMLTLTKVKDDSCQGRVVILTAKAFAEVK
jgi:hypothetical protein